MLFLKSIILHIHNNRVVDISYEKKDRAIIRLLWVDSHRELSLGPLKNFGGIAHVKFVTLNLVIMMVMLKEIST